MRPSFRFSLPSLALMVVLTLAAPAAAEPVSIETGTITYRVVHRVKTFDGVTPASAATVQLDWGDGGLDGLRFEAAIPLATFDSGNHLRDEHAAEALELFLFPQATWTVEKVEVVRQEPQTGAWTAATVIASGPLTLHGVSEVISVEVALRRAGDVVAIKGSFPISLSAFGVQRPALLGVRIEDEVTVTVDLEAPATGR